MCNFCCTFVAEMCAFAYACGVYASILIVRAQKSLYNKKYYFYELFGVQKPDLRGTETDQVCF